MKIAVTSTGPTLDDQVEARFGRCRYFLIIDTDTMQFEAIENPNITLGGGAGIQSAQLMSEKGVTTVLTGNCGPNAFNVFGQAGIQVIVGVSGSIRSAVDQFKAGTYSSTSGPSVASHFGMNTPPAGPTPMGQPMTDTVGQSGGMGLGMSGGQGKGHGGGRGRGMGGGRGMGLGMGKGGGRGMGMGGGGMAVPPTGISPPREPILPQTGGQFNSDQELQALKTQAKEIADQLNSITARIEEIEQHRHTSDRVAVVDVEKCTGCGICERICPRDAIKVNGQAIVNPDLCTACGLCVSECPNSAIAIAQRKIDNSQ